MNTCQRERVGKINIIIAAFLFSTSKGRHEKNSISETTYAQVDVDQLYERVVQPVHASCTCFIYKHREPCKLATVYGKFSKKM